MRVTARKDSVALRFPRPVILTAAIGLAMAWTAVGSVPALADQVRQQQWWLGALHVTQAQRISTGSGVTIALLDTGVDPAQPDLTGSVITGPNYTDYGTAESPGGEFYGIHGTAMASLIVGHGHGPGDANGVLGVAPGARLLSVRVALDADDPLLANSAIMANLPNGIATAIRYAVSSGAQVIDLPLDPGQSPSALVSSPPPAPGTPPTPDALAQQAAAGGSAAEQAAISFALRKGVVLVAPAGDTGTSTDGVNFPASYPGVISVGAFDSTFTKAPFTSHQPYVTLTAAGNGMTTATPAGYATVSTTAAASAVVTGIAAMIRSQYPELTPAQVSQALTSSTVFRPPGGLNGSGHGTADAARALAAAAAIAKPVPARAGAGAVARPLPAAPSVPFIDRGLGQTLLRDALISLAVLLVLLLPIAAYVLVRRRRTRTRTLARADRELGARSAYVPGNGSAHADEMLEYFAAMPGEPAGSRAARFPDAAGRGSAVEDTYPGPGASGPVRLPRTPMTWAHAPRTPAKVSGSPPWEPARQPDSELPWTAPGAPTPPVSPPPVIRPPRVTPSARAATPGSRPAPAGRWREPADDDAPEPAGPAEPSGTAEPPGAAEPSGTAEPAGIAESAGAAEPAGSAEPADAAETASAAETSWPGTRGGTADEGGPAHVGDEPDSGPIFVWNPGASTESFPTVPRDG